MASFEIADCPTTLALAKDAKGGQAGNLALNVRNATGRTQAARVRVEPQGGAQAGWFAIDGASPTSPAEKDLDFEARASQTVKVTVAVPAGTPGGDHLFRVRVTSERDPDNDYTQSPAVAFKVPPPAAAPPVAAKRAFPWWMVAAAVGVVVVVGAIFAWMIGGEDANAEVAVPTNIGDAFLDYCLQWGTQCGQPAADAFCQRNGFARSSSWKLQTDSPPTIVLATNQRCPDAFCDRISELTCVK